MSGRREVRERPDVGSRLSGFIELAERIVYYGAALFLLLTIVMVFLSVVAGLRDIAEAGLLQTALEILDKVLLIFIFAELLSTISTTIREREIAA